MHHPENENIVPAVIVLRAYYDAPQLARAFSVSKAVIGDISEGFDAGYRRKAEKIMKRFKSDYDLTDEMTEALFGEICPGESVSEAVGRVRREDVPDIPENATKYFREAYRLGSGVFVGNIAKRLTDECGFPEEEVGRMLTGDMDETPVPKEIKAKRVEYGREKTFSELLDDIVPMVGEESVANLKKNGLPEAELKYLINRCPPEKRDAILKGLNVTAKHMLDGENDNAQYEGLKTFVETVIGGRLSEGECGRLRELTGKTVSDEDLRVFYTEVCGAHGIKMESK